jgi:hypothetical protein
LICLYQYAHASDKITLDRKDSSKERNIMDFGPQQLGKWLIAAGIVIAAVGALIVLLGRVGLFKLPGDLEFGSRNWRIYVPVASCILISIILTLILWLISYFRR